jgi:hypothetical protein
MAYVARLLEQEVRAASRAMRPGVRALTIDAIERIFR